MAKVNFFKLAFSVIVCQLAGFIGSFFTISAIPTWYTGLIKPTLNPPAWIFGPVWIILYTLMGVAFFLVWQRGLERREVKMALSLFVSQLVLNATWSVVFFGLHNPAWALAEIIILFVAIAATIFSFAKISRPAAWLLVPYILWVGFASYLNFSIWQLNKETGGVACTQEAKQCPDGSYVGRTGPLCEFTTCPR